MIKRKYQGIKKGLTLILAFLISPIVPLLIFSPVYGIFEGTTSVIFVIPKAFMYVYAAFFLLILVIALPTYFLLLLADELFQFLIVIIVGWAGGYLVARLNMGLDPESNLSGIAFSITGALTGVVFWSILKAGGANET